jgi:hypothetical protein
MSAAYEHSQFHQDMFNFYCIIMNIDNIRRHVKTVWEDYRQGKVDIFVAFVITEMAFQLLQRLGEESMAKTMFGKPMAPVDQACVIWRFHYIKGNVQDRYTKDHPVEALAELLGMKSVCLISEIMGGRLITDAILGHLLKV